MHQYKFIVDGEWRFSPDDPTAPDEQGNINNIIDTTNYEKDNKILNETEEKRLDSHKDVARKVKQ